MLIGWYSKVYQEARVPKRKTQEEESGASDEELLQLPEMLLLEVACQGVGEGAETQTVKRASHRRGTAMLALG